MKQPCQKWQGCWCYGLAQGCGRCTERRGCRITSGGIKTGAEMRGIEERKPRNTAGNRTKKPAGLKTREQDEESRHSMPGNRHTKRPDKSLGRSIAPRGSSRSNCQVKAILHGGIETGAEMPGKSTEGAGRAQRSGTEGMREGLFVVISTSSPINGDPFELTAASCGAYVQRRVFFRPA